MKPKHILYVIILLAFSNRISAQNCLPKGISFSTQGQLDSFPLQYPECTQILGDVRIKESVAGGITNLNGLLQITHIGGSLLLWNNAALTSLKGLDNVTSIQQHLSVNLNKALISLAGLERLDSIHGSFGLIHNDALSSLNGMNHLVAVRENVELSNNPLLVNFNGLDNLTSIGGYLSIFDNASLASINGLEQLTIIGGNLTVKNNNSLTSLDGFEHWATIGGNMDVLINPSLADDAKLDKVEKVAINRKQLKKPKWKPYRTWVTKTGKLGVANGYLRTVEDSLIVLSYNKVSKTAHNYHAQRIPVGAIKKIKFREKGKPLKGVLIGALSGFMLGGIIGLADGDDNCDGFLGNLFCHTAEEKAVIYGTGLAIPFALIGGIINTRKIKISINGNHDTYKQQKMKLLEYKY